MNEEHEIDIDFPLHGLAVDAPLSEQQPGTTLIGTNVRFHEAMTARGRGGSRPGISRLINEQVSGENAIQGLGFVVRTDGNALAWEFEGDDFSLTGLYLDVDLISPGPGDDEPTGGGGGFQPSESFGNDARVRASMAISHTTRPLEEEVEITVTVVDDSSAPLGLKRVVLRTSPGGADGDRGSAISSLVDGTATFTVSQEEAGEVVYIASVETLAGTVEARSRNVVKCLWGAAWGFLQAVSDQASIVGPGAQTISIPFSSPVVAGSLLLAFSEMGDTGASDFLDTVTDSQGNTYTRIHAANGNGVIFWAVAGSSGACTVNLNFTLGAGTLTTAPSIAEYSGAPAVVTVDGSSHNNDTNTAWTTGSITVSQAGTLLVGVFVASRIIAIDPALPTLTPGAGFNERLEDTHSDGTFESKVVWVDKLDASASEAVAATASASYLYTAAGASFSP